MIMACYHGIFARARWRQYDWHRGTVVSINWRRCRVGSPAYGTAVELLLTACTHWRRGRTLPLTPVACAAI